VKLPTPEQVRINDPRICTRENRAINWDLVDVFLRVIKDAGGLTLLSDKLCIDRGSLLKRRRELKLKPLPAGRPKVVKLTIEEEAIYNLITDWHSPVCPGARAWYVSRGRVLHLPARYSEEGLDREAGLPRLWWSRNCCM
jgi:hypothetical protein